MQETRGLALDCLKCELCKGALFVCLFVCVLRIHIYEILEKSPINVTSAVMHALTLMH